MRNFIIISGLLTAAAFTLTGCPAKVDPGQNVQSGYKTMSTKWGIPVIHAITAGFNGSVSEPNLSGPANTANTSTPTK